MTSEPKTNGSRVISVATGSTFFSGFSLSLNDKSLDDYHGEILARRGLCVIPYDQLESCSTHTRESITFKPDGNIYSFNDKKSHLLASPCQQGSLSPCGFTTKQGLNL